MTANRTKHGAIRKRVLATSLLLALGAAPIAYGQAITGGLSGVAPTESGITIRVDGVTTGLVRVLRPNARGRYTTRGLNPGEYSVEVLHNGKVLGKRLVHVAPNATTNVPSVAAAPSHAVVTKSPSETLNAIQVTANRSDMETVINPIDVTTPELVTNYSMQLINKLPVGRSPQSISLLQSNVTYDDQTTGSVEMGGATPAGNTYFLNGFDITDADTGINNIGFPAEAIANTSIISSGSGASWSNTAGGIFASTIRQGDNDFKGGYSMYITPPTSRLLEPRGHDVYNANGDHYRFVSQNRHATAFTSYLWGSGPIIKNKLFFFALLGKSPPSRSRGVGQQSMSVGSSRDKNALVNLTWDITQNQTLDVFGSKDLSSSSTNSYFLTQKYNHNAIGRYAGWSGGFGNQHYLIGNYHYNITPNLSLSLMAGYVGVNSGSPLVGEYVRQPYVAEVNPTTQVTTILSNNEQTFYGSGRPFHQRGFRGTVNWRLGPNNISFGLEQFSYAVTESFGSNPFGFWTYYDRPGAVLGNGFTVPGDGKYVDEFFRQTGGTVPTVTKAAFVQDYWNATRNLVLYGALRDDIYNYKNTDAVTFIRFNTLSPRFGASWDVDGDGRFKVGGNVGKYNQQLPLNFTFGVAGVDFTADKYFTYTGMDPVTFAPTGLTQIGPENVEVAPTPPPATQIAVDNLKTNSIAELNLYVQKDLGTSGWSGLAEFSGSKLLRAINETCDGFAIDAYAHSHGFPNYDLDQSLATQCIEFNPGSSLAITRDFAGNGTNQTLTVPNSFYGMPDAKRKYMRLTFQLSHERSEEQPYYLNVSYTWAHEFGNDNGLLDLQRGDPGYIGQTPEFDFPQMQVGGYGDLNQDIRNSFVISGAYFFKNHINVGAVINGHTGQPLSCFGTFTIDPASYVAQNYGASTYVCGGRVVPLGSAGRLPFFWALNLSVGYDWRINRDNDLSVNLQMFNVTNRRGIINENQTFDQGFIPPDGVPPLNVNYGLPAYQAPRTALLAIRYTWGG